MLPWWLAVAGLSVGSVLVFFALRAKPSTPR
jgi:hypothetical protein